MKLVKYALIFSLAAMLLNRPSTTLAITVIAKNDQVKGPIGICPDWPECPPPSSEKTPPAKIA